MIDVSLIKLIIWDLDNTLWEGVLSEEAVTGIERNNELIRTAADKGIVNSICSKNDISKAREELQSDRFGGLWDMFVFPSVDWTPKGPRIHQMLEDMALRAENVLFVDDEPFNLNEALHENPGLMTAGPDVLDELYRDIRGLESTDPEHKRLERYRLLERKTEKKHAATSNEQFLRESDIRITYHYDCGRYADRIHELLARTNQLNFTKIRPTEEEVASMLSDPRFDCAVVSARDNYGDYGEIGFYALDRGGSGRLVHFAFSCRALGMGIEQYTYEKLGFPPLSVSGETAVTLKNEKTVDWIREISEEKESVPVDKAEVQGAGDNISAGKILLKGPCDIDGMLPYFQDLDELELEASFVDDRGIVVGSNCSIHLYEAWHYPTDEIRKTIARSGFLSEADFVTYMFSGHYRAVVFSTLSEGHSGVYRDRENGLRICFSSRNFDLTDKSAWDSFISGEYANHNVRFTRESLADFSERFVFEGGLDPAISVRNLRWMREKLSPDTKLILLLGSEIEAQENTPEFAEHAPIHRAFNERIKEAFADDAGVEMINVTDLITGQDCFAGCTDHYSRVVYKRLAETIRTITGRGDMG